MDNSQAPCDENLLKPVNELQNPGVQNLIFMDDIIEYFNKRLTSRDDSIEYFNTPPLHKYYTNDNQYAIRLERH